MKCKVCRKKAEIKVARHNAAFCAEHYKKHIHRQIERTIKKFKLFSREDKLLLGVSGGKDSMALWKALIELEYRVKAVHLKIDQEDFFERSEAVVRTFSSNNNLDLIVYPFEELTGFKFRKAFKYVNRPACSLCGSFKRYYLNRLAGKLGCNVLVTGHNLDDENAALLGNILHWQMTYLKRQSPVLEAEYGMVKKVKPAVRITDREMKDYADISGIDYVDKKCPYSKGAKSHYYKDIMEQIETRYPGTKANFYFGFLKQFKANLKELEEDETKNKTKENYCIKCGYKTFRDDLCFICSLKEKMQN